MKKVSPMLVVQTGDVELSFYLSVQDNSLININQKIFTVKKPFPLKVAGHRAVVSRTDGDYGLSDRLGQRREYWTE